MKCKECGSASGEMWGHFDCPLCRTCLAYFEKRIDEICLNVAVKSAAEGAGNEPDLENSGVAYCEHYPEGLPVCSKCREESTLAHDKACALLAAARADAEHWKSECNALQRMVHEERAEIERKDKLIEQMRVIFIEMLAKSRVEVWAWKSKIEAALAAERGGRVMKVEDILK